MGTLGNKSPQKCTMGKLKSAKSVYWELQSRKKVYNGEIKIRKKVKTRLFREKISLQMNPFFYGSFTNLMKCLQIILINNVPIK